MGDADEDFTVFRAHHVLVTISLFACIIHRKIGDTAPLERPSTARGEERACLPWRHLEKALAEWTRIHPSGVLRV